MLPKADRIFTILDGVDKVGPAGGSFIEAPQAELDFAQPTSDGLGVLPWCWGWP